MLYNIVFVSAMYQHESVTGTYNVSYMWSLKKKKKKKKLPDGTIGGYKR